MLRNINLFNTLIITFCLTFNVSAQQIDNESPKKLFIGSTFFMLGNLAPSNPPDFVQLNLGYRISAKDAISLELKTWKYAWSLGIPYGSAYENPAYEFPGFIREGGVALAYQHFWWKGLYNAVHIMGARQWYNDENGQIIEKGFQIFNTYRVGYQFKFFNNRFFIEPSVCITHRPFHTKMPDGFKVQDDQWPKYFIGEPGLHFGFNF
ncbi:MAG: hypothetical protein JXQ87_15375 [Bacteroidia bacterium]